MSTDPLRDLGWPSSALGVTSNTTPPYNKTETALETRARTLLAYSIRTIGDGSHKFIYPTACISIDGIVDSTTTLITARTVSKLGRSDLSWDFLRTLFIAQGSNGVSVLVFSPFPVFHTILYIQLATDSSFYQDLYI
mmetsp:Transcript_17311/g.31438  ORF Transcript_17311/g.31438 Transcript_17311/m.31438 type:complete len:137 (-) Transcript_17311:254-664(-)